MKIEILALLLTLSALLCVSCGVKGPPLPPMSAMPPTLEEKSLGRKATPIAPIPSALPGGE